jgi:uncharacterized protein YjiS (DUF1127 family)
MTTLEGDRIAHPTTRSVGEIARTALDHISSVLIVLMDWQDRARQRRQLLALSDAALKDFGASRADADGEGSKPFWQR